MKIHDIVSGAALLLLAVVVGIAMSVIIHVAFVDFLRVPLPRGVLDPVLW